MNYYLIAGEASGDMHASNLMSELKKLDASAEFRAWGGDLMQEQGAFLVKHYRELAFMGFTEVIKNLRTIFRNIERCKKDILQHKPDVLILVDYPGFNLRIATYARQIGIPVFYYISPQVWAWKQSRVQQIKRDVNKMYVILPFEQEFYKQFGIEVDFIGHPLLDAIGKTRQQIPPRSQFIADHHLKDLPIVALLPGSRKQEVDTMLPIMLSVVKDFPEYQFVIAGAPSLQEIIYEKHSRPVSVPVISGNTYELLSHAEAALVTSGTATLETALLRVPEVVCYKGGKISYYIARSLIKVKFISLVNLIMDREVVKELIQQDLNTKNLSSGLRKLFEPKERERIIHEYDLLSKKLGGAGASEKAARLMVEYLRIKIHD